MAVPSLYLQGAETVQRVSWNLAAEVSARDGGRSSIGRLGAGHLDRRMSRPIGDRKAAAALAILLAGVLAGCITSAPTRAPTAVALVPTTVGVVTSIERLTGRTVVYQLSSGKVLQVDLAAANILSPGEPGQGYLLLSGTEGSGRTWIVGLFPYVAADAPPDCFRLAATGTGVDGWIDFSIGLRLPTASNFDPGPISNERYAMERLSFCINENGEVLSYG
jgi:hypothetical protein